MRLCLLVFAIPFSASAADLHLQIRLLNDLGAPVSGSHDVTIAIYDDATPGADVSCYTATLGATVFSDGYASLTLSNVDPACAQGDKWVAIAIGSPAVEFSPRQQLGATPRSLTADHVAGYVDLFVDTDFSDGPGCTVEGRMAWESGSSSIVVCDGSDWIQFGSGGAGVTGGTAINSALSCLELQSDFPSAISGTYWIDPDGSGPVGAFQTDCDMAGDEGGWTLVYAIADSSTMETTGAFSEVSLRGHTVSAAVSGKLSDTVIRLLYTEQYRMEQWGSGADYCVFSNVASYADGSANDKTCGSSYSSTATYSGAATGNYTQGFSSWNQPGGIITQLHYQDSGRWGSHIRSGLSSNSDAGCSSAGGCHVRVWVR